MRPRHVYPLGSGGGDHEIPEPSLDFVSPSQLGGTVAFLCSAAAEQITGTAIAVDGGWTAQ